MADAPTPCVQVLVCWSLLPRQVIEHPLSVPAACSVQSVLAQLMTVNLPSLNDEAKARLPFLQPGIWGRKVSWDQTIEAGDRIELYRDLQVDPKVARRQRFKRQGKGRTGLFANRKSGVAAGY